MRTASDLAHEQLRSLFGAPRESPTELLIPLSELSGDSPTLLQGYAPSQQGWNRREDMIPYYHILGRSTGAPLLRSLILGGWSGTDRFSTYALSRLIAALEGHFQLVDGIEATVYPILNLDALRRGVPLTEEQVLDGGKFWASSGVRHIRVVERELLRYDYDLVIHLREIALATNLGAAVWTGSSPIQRVVGRALAEYGKVDAEFQWKINGNPARFTRKVTPVPERDHQPTEIALGLPGTLNPEAIAQEVTGLILSLLHAARQARAEGAS